MKKGFQMFTVRDLLVNPHEMLAVFTELRKMGYESVQGYRMPFLTLAQYKEILEEAGLEDCSSNADFERMRDDPSAIRAAVEEADFMGNTQIAISTLPPQYRESEEGFKRYADEINKIARILVKEGKKMLYHPHALEFYSFGGGRKGMDILLEETDPEGFWFCLDTHWLVCGGVDIGDWYRKAGGRMSIVHYKDYAVIPGAKKVEEVHKRYAEVGEGNIDWSKVVQVSREIGIEHAVVEQDECPANPMDSLAVSFKNMSLFGI